jgi:hypothetical protein
MQPGGFFLSLAFEKGLVFIMLNKFHGVGVRNAEQFLNYFGKLCLVGLLSLCVTVLVFLQAFPIAKYLHQLFNRVLSMFDWNFGMEPKLLNLHLFGFPPSESCNVTMQEMAENLLC